MIILIKVRIYIIFFPQLLLWYLLTTLINTCNKKGNSILSYIRFAAVVNTKKSNSSPSE